ncbi:ATP-binding protein [Psychromarinibacter sp. C21-152]|uniref:histidine kinase n=1 Tax=Psychromarinibacter sediminicola TaxID=3033385 RepID=A0AAE3NP07_9RHOB|nr:ATP-binding protein [Psychromarinibacter sediminicola]MDF0599431.1 ATP-binding protein [Psychromarinibacter sediminicola]
MAEPPGSLTRIALAVAPRWPRVLAPAVGFLGLALFFRGGFAGSLFLVAGATLIALGLSISWLVHRHRARQGRVTAAVAALIGRDAVPSFLTDESGRVTYRNAAASARYPGRPDQTLAAAIGDHFAAPAHVLRRMRLRADAQGAAAEDVATAKGALRLSVTQAEPCGHIWRLDDHGTASAAEIEMPMLRLSKTGSIVEMNQAMAALLGGRPASIDRIVSDPPLRKGQLHHLDTAKGQLAAHLAMLEEPGGLTQVYVWPSESPDRHLTHADAIPVPIMKIAPEGRILMANRRARTLLELPDEDGLEFSAMVEGLGRPVEEWLRDVSDGRGTTQAEVVRATRPQKDVYLQVALGRMVDGGGTSLLAVLIDATELKTLEAQFVQSQKMQAVGQLAGGVAHDFNNLLTAISGHCDLLLLRHEAGDPDYGDLVQINQNANRAAALVGQLLAFSRKQNMQPELIDMRDALGDLTHLLNRLVGEKIRLDWTHDNDLPRLRADKRQLEQVLMNLVVNARDAMPEGGQIRIATRAVRLAEPLHRDRAEVPAGDYVVVTVEDEGCGIAADRLAKIFEPFYSTKRTGEGTGLGLSMAYGIVKQTGGFIFADSVPGQGTVFSMYFPAHRGGALPAVASGDAVARPAARPNGGVVLLVEDEAPVRAFAGRALRLRGHTVLEADSAEAALKLLEDPDLEVDVFVTDVVMPGMDGPTWVAQALKARPDTRVVFVSGYAEDSISHNRAKIPNSVFLPKPFSLAQLTETVQSQV